MQRVVSFQEVEQRAPASLDALYKMNLNETMFVEATNTDPFNTSVMRVPGGWIYRSFDHSLAMMSCVFVPFNNEYME